MTVLANALNQREDTSDVPLPGRGWERGYARGAVVGDVACSAAAIAGLIAARSALGDLYWVEIVIGLGLTLAWPLAVAIAGGYEAHRMGDGPDEYRAILQAALGVGSLVAIAAYITQTQPARSLVMIGVPLIAFLDLVFRHVMRKSLHRRRGVGQCVRRVVVVGHRGSAAELIAQLRRERYHGMHVVAACLPDRPPPTAANILDVPVLGDFTDVPEVVTKVDADAVAVLACPELDGTVLRRLSWRLAESFTDLYVASALMEVAGPRTSVRPVAGLPLLHVDHPDLSGVRQYIKSAFDKVAGALALVTLSPIICAIAVMVKLSSSGPIFFKQTRVGKDGREFMVYKFRTMVVDAEKLRLALVQQDEGNGVLFKIRNDPRITSIGMWLRRYSVDELPQLLNVLRGDMSLVGPRPPLPEEVAQYGDDVRRRLVVKPGITGLWQVSGRSDLSWEESVRLDLRYVENWSLTLDLQILWKTWSVVVRGIGAY